MSGQRTLTATPSTLYDRRILPSRTRILDVLDSKAVESTQVEILIQTGKYADAFKTLDQSEAWASSHHLEGHLCAAEINRGDLWNRMGKTDLAIVSYRRALEYADHLSFWRGFTSTGGSLAKALAREGHLDEALQIIDRALSANTHIPDELYFVPRTLAVKAEILRQMGRISESNDNYKRSTTLIDSLLTSSPTPGVERLLLADLSDVYSGYFISLVQQGRNADAFTIIEKAYGRIETQSLEHHAAIAPHAPSGSEQRISARQQHSEQPFPSSRSGSGIAKRS